MANYDTFPGSDAYGSPSAGALHAPTLTSASMTAADLTAPDQPTRSTASLFYRRIVKRGLDIVLVLMAAIAVVPVVGVFALVIFLADGKSPFYSQERVGRGRRVFRMWKLRSMVPNADARLEAYLAETPEARAEWEVAQKLRHDPRITPIGRFIRKSSIDELPQLWNGFCGQMSLVGPRPMMVCQRALYPGAAYYAMRPGITGLWQTSARNEASFSERAQFDTAYFGELSFLTDIRILFRTVDVVVKGTGY